MSQSPWEKPDSCDIGKQSEEPRDFTLSKGLRRHWEPGPEARAGGLQWGQQGGQRQGAQTGRGLPFRLVSHRCHLLLNQEPRALAEPLWGAYVSSLDCL